MSSKAAILFLIVAWAAATDLQNEADEDPGATPPAPLEVESIRSDELEPSLLEKALISKKKMNDNYDRMNMRFLNNAAHDEAKRAATYHHRAKENYQKKKRPRPLILGPKERKPNIILILTDDQDVELVLKLWSLFSPVRDPSLVPPSVKQATSLTSRVSPGTDSLIGVASSHSSTIEYRSLNFMPRTLRLLRDGGAEFRHAYVTTPMCCPSRSSLLTGMYVHNHNVFTNNENCSSQAWQRTHETRTFATYLSNAGYRTGYFGKYLNKYNGSYVPAGWREWGGLIMNSRYYNYSINLNGRRVRHGADYERDYYTDLIANDSVSFLRQSKQYFSRKPVMLVLSFPAPHGPEDSAPQFSDMFFNVTTHHTPAYDYAPNPDKQWILQVTNRMQGIHKQFTDLLMTKRLQTLQSVDLAVERVYQELKDIGELDNTYIVYTSDHGYHLGQFGLVKGKSFPFEFDVRVPFLVRGPGVQPGTVVEDIVLNIDLAPTFLDMAGVEAPPHMDGRSILKLLHPPRGARRPKWPDTFLIESSGRREPEVTRPKWRHKISETTPPEIFENATEVFMAPDVSHESAEIDVTDDEDDIIDGGNIPEPPLPTILQEDLAHDNKIPGLPKPAVGTVDCLRPENRPPCRPQQKWFCVFDGIRWRKHKCRMQTCACFTQQGYMYTRPPQPGDEIRMSDPLLHVLHSRRKRDIEDDHISDIVDDLDAELEDVQDTQLAIRNSTLWQCSVTSQGVVNCSDVVYSDYKTWRETRDKTEAKIRLLKLQLTSLKELRRHLKEKRPPHGGNESLTTEIAMDVEEETEDYSTTYEDVETTTEFIPSTTTSQEPTEITSTKKNDESWVNRIDVVPVRSDHDTCYCSSTPFGGPRRDEKELAKEAKRKLKEEKMRKKERKTRKKLKMEKQCLSEKMNCFNHDNQHWRTPPLWTEGPFCFCMNSANNTYFCLRTINATHNFLYCEFVTGFTTFYNIRIDPFEQLNRVSSLTVDEKRQLSEQLADLRSCRGAKECSIASHTRRH